MFKKYFIGSELNVFFRRSEPPHVGCYNYQTRSWTQARKERVCPQSQRDFLTQPRVASPRATLGAAAGVSQPQRGCGLVALPCGRRLSNSEGPLQHVERRLLIIACVKTQLLNLVRRRIAELHECDA